MPCRGPPAIRSVVTGVLVATASTCTSPRLLPQCLRAGCEAPLPALLCDRLCLVVQRSGLPLQQHRGSLRSVSGMVPASRRCSKSPNGSIEWQRCLDVSLQAHAMKWWPAQSPLYLSLHWQERSGCCDFDLIGVRNQGSLVIACDSSQRLAASVQLCRSMHMLHANAAVN